MVRPAESFAVPEARSPRGGRLVRLAARRGRAMGAPALLACLLPLAGCGPTPKPNTQTTTQRTPGPFTAHSNKAIPQAVTGAFDLFLLNLSWSPEFCHSHPTAAECAAHDTFVLHGLWPENADGSYPSNCSTAPGPSNPAKYSDLYPDPGLLQHEWQTHGTCSGLSADAYFQTVRSAFKSVTIPPAFTHLTGQISLPPAQIKADFSSSNPSIPPNDTIVTCGSNFLTAVEVCLDKSLHPIACPAAIHSCAANTIRIPAPQ
jgi:ribonuclease T2